MKKVKQTHVALISHKKNKQETISKLSLLATIIATLLKSNHPSSAEVNDPRVFW